MENKIISINELKSYEYICQLCGEILTSEKELTDHILSNHIIKKQSIDSELQELKETLKSTYPDYEISIISLNNHNYKYKIKLTNKSGAIINQYYKNNLEAFIELMESEGYTPRVIDTIEDLITDINYKINDIKNIIDRLTTTNKFEYIEFVSFNYGNYGHSECESSCIFKFKTKDGLYEDTIDFKPYQQTIDEFIDDFKQYFETELKGEGEIVTNQGYLVGYKIGNTNIEGIFNKAKLLGKKVQLAII